MTPDPEFDRQLEALNGRARVALLADRLRYARDVDSAEHLVGSPRQLQKFLLSLAPPSSSFDRECPCGEIIPPTLTGMASAVCANCDADPSERAK